MKLSHLAAAAAIALGSASASAIDLGSLNLATGSAFFGNTPVAGSFTDTLTFTITTTSFFNASVTTVVNGAQDVDFTTIRVTGTGGSIFNLTQVNPDPIELWATPAAGFTLTAGTYTMTLTGSNSAAIGSYAGNVAVTPVPEPHSLALLLAGMGALGFMVRRRKG